jgi:predicted Zn-dependent protease with MMP-like domain
MRASIINMGERPPGLSRERASVMVRSMSRHAELVAPSLDDLDAIAREAWAALPGAFRQMAGDLVFRIEDFADEETLDALQIEDPFDLTGLYTGVDLTRQSMLDPSPSIPMVFLYRRPILDEWCERGDVTLADLVVHVLVHEVGHHFGLSDAEIDAILERA